MARAEKRSGKQVPGGRTETHTDSVRGWQVSLRFLMSFLANEKVQRLFSTPANTHTHSLHKNPPWSWIPEARAWGRGGSFCQVFTLSKKYEGQGSTLHLEFLAKERGPRPPTEEAAGSNCPRPRHSHELLPHFLSHGQAVPADPACPPTPTQRGASRPQDPSRLIADVGKESSHESLQDARQTQDVPAEPAQHRGLRLQAHPRLPGPTRPPGHSFWADPGTFPWDVSLCPSLIRTRTFGATGGRASAF